MLRTSDQFSLRLSGMQRAHQHAMQLLDLQLMLSRQRNVME